MYKSKYKVCLYYVRSYHDNGTHKLQNVNFFMRHSYHMSCNNSYYVSLVSLLLILDYCSAPHAGYLLPYCLLQIDPYSFYKFNFLILLSQGVCNYVSIFIYICT